MKAFSLGAGTALGAIIALNARVLLFAAAYHKLPPELRDGKAAALSVEQAIAAEADFVK